MASTISQLPTWKRFEQISCQIFKVPWRSEKPTFLIFTRSQLLMSSSLTNDCAHQFKPQTKLQFIEQLLKD
jgi:hypothetical protein